jgi:hypothetical protein
MYTNKSRCDNRLALELLNAAAKQCKPALDSQLSITCFWPSVTICSFLSLSAASAAAASSRASSLRPPSRTACTKRLFPPRFLCVSRACGKRSMFSMKWAPKGVFLRSYLQRWHHRLIPSKRLTRRLKHSQLSDGLAVVLLAPGLELHVHTTGSLVIRVQQQGIHKVRQEGFVCKKERLVGVRHAKLPT